MYDPFLTPRPPLAQDITYDQMFHYPNSIQDVLRQVKNKNKMKQYQPQINPTETKKKPTSKPHNVARRNKHLNVSRF